MNQLYVDKLSRMIQVPTVSSYGQTDLSRFYEFHKLLEELFPNVFEKCEKEEYEGSLLLIWRGKSSDSPVLFMNHMDVVEPQDESSWTYPPFSGELHDGKLWGRGSVDTKAGLCLMLQAADELIAEGFVPEQDIYFESSCNEETSGNGAKYFAGLLDERGIRFSYILDEGGIVTYEPIDGVKANFAMIGMGEKGCYELEFTASDGGGHASAPEMNSPLVRLGRFMAEADTGKVFKSELSPVICKMLKSFSKYEKGFIRMIYAHPELFSVILKKILSGMGGNASAFVRTTIAFTMAKGSDGRNVIPSNASVVASMRTSHHQGNRDSLKAITELAGKYDITVSVLDAPVETKLSDVNSAQYRFLETGLKKVYDIDVAPYIMTGCSDSRFFEHLTDNCFRIVPVFATNEQISNIHGINENINVDMLDKAVKVYRYLYTEGRDE